MKNAKDTKNTKNSKNAKSTPNTQNARNIQNAKDAQRARTYKIIMCCSIALVVILASALIIVLVNRDTSGDDTLGRYTSGSDASGNDLSYNDTSGNDTAGIAFSYSEDIDENGFWEGIRALDYVEIFNYQSMTIPNDIHNISDGDLQAAINSLLEYYYPETKQIMDREVADGDRVNIDYVGSVDGVEFDGGSTGGSGTDVTAGSTGYIDDFLTQIIGHMPGETVNVEVTFPDVYENNPDLQGKDAVFVTTINYIVEYDITDEFIEENLYDGYGWKTIGEMEEGEREGLQKTAVENYIREYMQSAVTVSGIPDTVAKYQENSLVFYFQEYAAYYDMTLEEFLQSYEGVSSKDELIEKYSADNLKNATYYLVIQAVAEDAGISASDEDMDNYLPGYSSYEEEYGLPYLKQYVLALKILDYIIDNAVVA